MKFAMIPINRRYIDDKRIVRRILISYVDKKNNRYLETKVIDKDSYFNDPNSSQQYTFTDEYFYLVSNGHSGEEKTSVVNMLQNLLINNKRYYVFDSGLLIETAIEFEADSIEEAIKKFKEREELH